MQVHDDIRGGILDRDIRLRRIDLLSQHRCNLLCARRLVGDFSVLDLLDLNFTLRDDDARIVASAASDAGRASSTGRACAESGEGVTAGPTTGCADCTEGAA